MFRDPLSPTGLQREAVQGVVTRSIEEPAARPHRPASDRQLQLLAIGAAISSALLVGSAHALRAVGHHCCWPSLCAEVYIAARCPGERVGAYERVSPVRPMSARSRRGRISQISITDGTGKSVSDGEPGESYAFVTQERFTNPANVLMSMATDSSAFYHNDFTFWGKPPTERFSTAGSSRMIHPDCPHNRFDGRCVSNTGVTLNDE